MVIITDKNKDKIIQLYEPFIGNFVVVERKNQKKAIGILKSITPDQKLLIYGKYMTWIVDPSEVTDFSARPDKFSNQKRGGFN